MTDHTGCWKQGRAVHWAVRMAWPPWRLHGGVRGETACSSEHLSQSPALVEGAHGHPLEGGQPFPLPQSQWGQPCSPRGTLPPTPAAADWIKGRGIQAGPIKPLPWEFGGGGAGREAVRGLSDVWTSAETARCCAETGSHSQREHGERGGGRQAGAPVLTQVPPLAPGHLCTSDFLPSDDLLIKQVGSP